MFEKNDNFRKTIIKSIIVVFITNTILICIYSLFFLNRNVAFSINKTKNEINEIIENIPNNTNLKYIKKLEKIHKNIELISIGSSLKMCLVAEGTADIYPRFSPTMEWDTAAGHAIVKAVGKNIYQEDEKNPLIYNKENLQNPYFIVK